MLHKKHHGCRLCSSQNLSCVLPLRPIPLGEHYSTTPQTIEERFPIDIYMCNDCTAVQTNDDIDPNFLWDGYTYFSGQTKKILEHFNDFAFDITDNYFKDQTISVLDIGSNDGSLLECFARNGHSVTGVDPAETVVSKAHEKGISTHLGLFTHELATQKLSKSSYNLVTAFNVFAHSSDMESMIRGVEYCLDENGLFCFEVQYLGAIAKKNILGTFFHEHMIHYSLSSADNFISKNGLQIIDYRVNNIQNGSIIFICSKTSWVEH